MQNQFTQNGQQSGQRPRPQDQLDLYQDVVDSTAVDPFLDKQNLGLGNYTSAEMWQQVQSYRNGLYAAAAFRRLIEERSKKETRNRLAINGWDVDTPQVKKEWKGWDQLTPDERKEIWDEELANNDSERFDRRRWIRRRGEQVLNELYELRDPEYQRFPAHEALSSLSGHDSNWEPAHNRMLMARHETSRSRGARLVDNVFQRVKETKQDIKD